MRHWLGFITKSIVFSCNSSWEIELSAETAQPSATLFTFPNFLQARVHVDMLCSCVRLHARSFHQMKPPVHLTTMNECRGSTQHADRSHRAKLKQRLYFGSFLGAAGGLTLIKTQCTLCWVEGVNIRVTGSNRQPQLRQFERCDLIVFNCWSYLSCCRYNISLYSERDFLWYLFYILLQSHLNNCWHSGFLQPPCMFIDSAFKCEQTRYFHFAKVAESTDVPTCGCWVACCCCLVLKESNEWRSPTDWSEVMQVQPWWDQQWH